MTDTSTPPAPATPTPTQDLAARLVEGLNAKASALEAVDEATFASLAETARGAVRRGLRRNEAISEEQVDARARKVASEEVWTHRAEGMAALAALIDDTTADAAQTLEQQAAARREVALPTPELTAEEQQALAQSTTGGLLTPLERLVGSGIVEQRRQAHGLAALVALLELPDTTPTPRLLERMADASDPWRARRAEAVLRDRLQQLRIDAATAEQPADRQAARDALARFEAIREARVPEEVRAAEARERAAWDRLVEHARHVGTRARSWASTGVSHDFGAEPETLQAWRQEREALLADLRNAWRGVPRRG